MAKGYKDLHVWNRAVELAEVIYQLTKNFPKEEIYGLTSQMKRAAISISSNIAEGSGRNSKKDFGRFISIAFGSGAELESQVELAKKLSFGIDKDYITVSNLLEEVMKMLNVLRTKYTISPMDY